MAQTITFVLGGDSVPLDSFSSAVDRFRIFVSALQSESAGGADIQWTIESLETSSAMMTVAGRPGRTSSDKDVAAVVVAYERAGRAMQAHELTPFSLKVQSAADSLLHLLNESVESIRLETAHEDFVITEFETHAPQVVPIGRVKRASYGAVSGRIQTVSNRGGLRFTLYDTMHDKAVSCYLSAGQEDLLRGLWGQTATVEGRILRDEGSGRPLTVRDIQAVTHRPEVDRDAWKAAIGIAPSASHERPEATVRRLRNAEGS